MSWIQNFHYREHVFSLDGEVAGPHVELNIETTLTEQVSIFFFIQGLIMKLPFWGQPPDQNCFDDSIYWEVGKPIPHKYISIGSHCVSSWLIEAVSQYFLLLKLFCVSVSHQFPAYSSDVIRKVVNHRKRIKAAPSQTFLWLYKLSGSLLCGKLHPGRTAAQFNPMPTIICKHNLAPVGYVLFNSLFVAQTNDFCTRVFRFLRRRRRTRRAWLMQTTPRTRQRFKDLPPVCINHRWRSEQSLTS